jgi:hypothetical protein
MAGIRTHDLSFQDSWKQKIDRAIGGESTDDASADGSSTTFDAKCLTIGTVGHPGSI